MKNYLCILFVAFVPVLGQRIDAPAFEVASIRPAQPGPGSVPANPRVNADGINFFQVTLRLCIQRAFGVGLHQVTGMPEPVAEARYNVVAKAAGPTPESKLMLMLRSLLTERFKLAVHMEKKEAQGFALVVGRNGPKLQEASDGVITIEGTGAGNYQVSMDQLAAMLARSLDRHVFNETGLKGIYKFELVAAELVKFKKDDLPSVYSALQEQLGLRLEPRRGVIDIVVVDHVEKPSEN